jgi:peroxiredoxin
MLARRVALASAASVAAAFTSAHARAARMAPLTVPPLTGIAAAPLLPLPSSAGGAPITAGSLWAERPAVVMVVRRPGCQLCRAEASKLHKVAPQLEAAGVRLVAVLQEDLPEQVAEFSAQYWPGELYLDQDKALFAAVGGGAVRRGSLLTFLNPFSRVWCARCVRHSALAAAQRAQRCATTAVA